MDSQKFCLKWNNFQNSVTSVFDSLRHDEELVDITLCCEGLKIKAHRMMLSACSPYFRDLLKENPCQHPVFFLKDTSYRDLSAVVEFVYKGEVNVAQSQLASFLKTAEMLQVRGLTGDDDDDQVSPTKPSVGGGGDLSGVRRAASPSSMRGRPSVPSSDQPSLSPPPPPSSSQPPLKRRRVSAADRSPRLEQLPVDTALDDNSGVELSPQPSTAAEPLPLSFHQQQQEHLHQQQHHLQGVDPPVKVEKVDLVEDSELEDESNHSLDAIGAQHMALFDPSMHHHQLQMHADESTDQLTGLLRAAGEQGGGMGDMSGGQIPSGVAEDGTPALSRWFCHPCGLYFKNASRLSEHRSVHRGETTCPICRHIATRRAYLKRHMLVAHGLQTQ